MEYQIIRSSRKSISIQIKAEGDIVVRCPKHMAKRDVQHFVDSKRSWIDAHLRKIEARPIQPKLTPEALNTLALRAKEVLPGRIALFASQVGVSYGRITVRAQHTRWGSCSSKGNLNFNCLLMLAPPQVQDYVVLHELCHRREMNHSQAFWQEVERVMPDYRVPKKWLRDNGSALMARLPE